MIISNNNDENLAEHSWFNFVVFLEFLSRYATSAHAWNFIVPLACGAYSLFNCWILQESLQNNKIVLKIKNLFI